MIKWFINRFILPYDPDSEAVKAPDGPKKEKKPKGGSNKDSGKKIHINAATGQSFVKREEETEDGVLLTWEDGTTSKVSWIEVNETTKAEKQAIEEGGLNLEKYEKVRPDFFRGLSPGDIAKHYKKHRVRGYSRSTLYPYYTLWEGFYRPSRPKN